MSEQEASNSNRALTFFGILGAFLVFGLLLFVAYLPNRPDPVNQAVIDERQNDADAVRAEGAGKLQGYEVLDAENGTARIPIESAMDLTVKAYRDAAASESE